MFHPNDSSWTPVFNCDIDTAILNRPSRRELTSETGRPKMQSDVEN